MFINQTISLTTIQGYRIFEWNNVYASNIVINQMLEININSTYTLCLYSYHM